MSETTNNIGTATAPTQGAERAQHHAYGPSRWPALLDCPCFESKPPTADTERGTNLHSLFERAMRGEEVEGQDALEWHVINAAKRILDAGDAETRYWLEERVGIPADMGHLSDVWGRLDAAWFDEFGNLHVADLKMAENPERDYTAQLAAYACGLLVTKGGGRQPETVFLHVVYADSGEITERRFAPADLWNLHESNYNTIADIGGTLDGGELKPRQCGWCGLCAKFATCRAAEETALAVVDKVKATDLQLTGAEMAQQLAMMEYAEKFIAARREYIKEQARNGVAVEDPERGIYYGFTERKGKFTTTPDDEWAVVRQHLTPDAFKGCLDVSTTRLESALKATGMKAKDAKALVESAGERGPSTMVFTRKGVRAA